MMNKNTALIFAVLSGISFGSVGVFVRIFTRAGFDNISILAARVLPAVLILLILFLVFDRSLLKIRIRDIWIFACAGILGTTGMNIFFNESVTRVPLSLTAVLLCLTPAVVMLFSAVIFKEKITLKKLGCMVMIIAGCLLVSGILENGRADIWSLPGVMSGIISAVFYAFYSVFSKLAVQRGYSGLTTAFYSILFVAIVTSLFADWNTVCEYVAILPAKNSAIILAHCICTSILPYELYTVVLRYADAGRASMLSTGGEPVAAMIFGFLFFGEMPTVLCMVGMAVTVTAMSMLCSSKKQLGSQGIQSGN